jgi:transcriptional regulator of heat shock response
MTINKTIRLNKVLEAIVKVHIETTLPVGSRHISRLLGLSSATIRNAMFELERAGYVKQPHTSAGRIPTDLGYRRYVDNMMRYADVAGENMVSEVQEYLREKKFFEDIIEATSQAVSRVTHYTGIALSPNNRLYFDGTYRMLEQPEFMEIGKASSFLRAVEERDELLDIMSRDLSMSGTTIHIGRENQFAELRECTIITSSYRFRNEISGNIGVIGPMRMEYERVVPMIEFSADMTTEMLNGVRE